MHKFVQEQQGVDTLVNLAMVTSLLKRTKE